MLSHLHLVKQNSAVLCLYLQRVPEWQATGCVIKRADLLIKRSGRPTICYRASQQTPPWPDQSQHTVRFCLRTMRRSVWQESERCACTKGVAKLSIAGSTRGVISHPKLTVTVWNRDGLSHHQKQHVAFTWSARVAVTERQVGTGSYTQMKGHFVSTAASRDLDNFTVIPLYQDFNICSMMHISLFVQCVLHFVFVHISPVSVSMLSNPAC